MAIVGVLALVFAILGTALHVIGLSVVYWLVPYPYQPGYGIGLWQACSIVGCHRHPPLPEYWKATQAFVVIGLIVAGIAVALSALNMCKKNKVFSILAGLACFLAAGCILTAIIIFGSEIQLRRDTQWGWGFIMCIISSFFFVPAGILNFVGMKSTT